MDTARRSSDRVGGAASLLLGQKDIEDRAAEAGFPSVPGAVDWVSIDYYPNEGTFAGAFRRALIPNRRRDARRHPRRHRLLAHRRLERPERALADRLFTLAHRMLSATVEVDPSVLKDDEELRRRSA